MAYVIEINGEIVGHINYSEGLIEYGDKTVSAVVLGPIAIHEKYQNRGLGSKLIEYTLNLANNMNIPFVVVIGDEKYYHRFGFESASKYNIFLNGTNYDEECPFFMIKIFEGADFKNETGIFYNPGVFDVCQSDVDEFDKQFEFKEKLILDSQLGE